MVEQDKVGKDRNLDYKLVGESGDVKVYEVSLTHKSTTIHQGYRAISAINFGNSEHPRYRELEVVVNGPGLNKARSKIAQEHARITDYSNGIEPVLDRRNSPKRKHRKAKHAFTYTAPTHRFASW